MLNLAYHFGISKFILLGYTMTVPKGFQQHFFGPHPKGLNQSTTSYRSFVGSYKQVQANIKATIVNCTPQSHLADIFRVATLEDELTATFNDDLHVQFAQPDPTPGLLGKRNVRAKQRNRTVDEDRNKRATVIDEGRVTVAAGIQRGNRSHRRNRSVSRQRAD